MKKFSVSYIRRWLVLLLILVVSTTIAAYLLTYVEMARILEDKRVYSDGAGEVAGTNKQHQIAGLKIRVLLILSGSTLIICIVGYVWVGVVTRHLNSPLRIISKALSRLARGKLNETVTINEPDEYADIAAGVNELAANLQELLLYIWKQTGHCLEQLKQIEDRMANNEDLSQGEGHPDPIHQLNAALDDLRDMAKAYVFYDVHLEGDKTLASSKPGKTIPSDDNPTNNNG